MAYQPGDILLDKYRIEKLIGRGAFGEVYHATHLRLQAARALKVLRRDAPGLGSSEYHDFQARFELEARLGARLDHPHIVRVYDFEQEDETLVLAMEYCPGGSLADRLERARREGALLPVEEALRMALAVAQALAALHALDAVHRDVKPSNILFDKDDNTKLGDLGLAQVPGGPSMRSRISGPNPHPGTPGYMSPEQSQLSNYLTPASDVYALGVVLFEALTGRVYASQPPGMAPGALRPELPEWLDESLGNMLAEEAKQRPWGGAPAAQLLEAALDRLTQARNQAQQAEAQRQQAAIDRLLERGGAALILEDWPAVESCLGELSRVGASGVAAARVLREQLSAARKAAGERARAAAAEQQRREAQQRAAEFRRLQDQASEALDDENWEMVESLILSLHGFAPEGEQVVQALQVQLAHARQAAQERQERAAAERERLEQERRAEKWRVAELRRLEREIENALQSETWDVAETALGQLAEQEWVLESIVRHYHDKLKTSRWTAERTSTHRQK